jgi:hypothetical protein
MARKNQESESSPVSGPDTRRPRRAWGRAVHVAGDADQGRLLPRREFLGLTGHVLVTATGFTLIASSQDAFAAAPGTRCGPGAATTTNTCSPATKRNKCDTFHPHSCDGQNAKNVCAGARWFNRCEGNGANTCKDGGQNICQQGPAETNECRGGAHIGAAPNRCEGNVGGPANECHDARHANTCDPAETGNKCTPTSGCNWCEETPQGSAHTEPEEP